MARARSQTGRNWRTGGWNFVAVLVLYFAVPVQAPVVTRDLLISLTLSVAAIGMTGWIVYREMFAPRKHRPRRLTTLRLALLVEIMTVLFALVYYILAVVGQGQMAGISTRIDALYYTIVTMSTVGYGDIVAVGQLARAVVIGNILFNLVFVAGAVSLARDQFASARRAAAQAATTADADDDPWQG